MPRSGWLAAGAVAAALAGPALGADAVLVGAALAMVGAATLARWRRILVPVAIGSAAIGLRLLLLPPPDAFAGPLPSGNGPWTGRIETVGAPRDGSQTATIRLRDPPILAAATLPRYPAVEPWDEVELEGRLAEPPDDGYGRYLRRIGASATLRATDLAVLGRDTGPGAALEDLRRASAQALALALPEPEAGLAAGILIGLRDRVDREVAADFTTAGISHVVAISGWNIAIVAASVAALGGRLGRRRRTLLIAAAIAAYVAFAGASPSVLRAAAMAGVVLIARESGRSGRASAALGWAVAILIAADPGLVVDAGFQLSAAATAGLVAWGTALTERVARLGRGRLPGWVAENLGVSLAAQAATLPIVLASFGRLALVAPAVNLIVVPLVAPAMAAGAVALGAGWLALAGAPAPLATLAGLPAWLLLTVVVRVADTAAALPFASVTLQPPLDVVAATASAIALALAARPGVRASIVRALRPARTGHSGRSRTSRGRASRQGRSSVLSRLAALCLVGAIVALGLVAAAHPGGRPRITVLDVGQGDAILVEGGGGGRMLVDGGPDPDRLLRRLDERLPPWDRRIDLLVLTHPHEDHVAGFPLLLERYRIGRVFEPGMDGPGPGYAAWQAGLAATGRQPELLAAGDRLAVDGVRLEALWPLPGGVPRAPLDEGSGINNVSIVLLGSAGGQRFLLMGDVEEDVDPVLVARGLPRVDLLKVAHHDSRTATTEAFLRAVRPAVAVVSAGARNRYGHPTRQALDRLAAVGARTFRTDTDGTVVATLDGSAVAVRTEGTAALPVAPEPALAVASAGLAFRCAIAPP